MSLVNDVDCMLSKFLSDGKEQLHGRPIVLHSAMIKAKVK